MSILFISNILGFVLGAVGLWATWILGTKSRRGWTISIVVEVGWVAYSVLIKQWAVAGTSFAWVALYARNWLSWKREDEVDDDRPPERRVVLTEGPGRLVPAV